MEYLTLGLYCVAFEISIALQQLTFDPLCKPLEFAESQPIGCIPY